MIKPDKRTGESGTQKTSDTKRTHGDARRDRKGRTRSNAAIIDDLLVKKIAVAGNDLPSNITALDAIILQLINKSAAGDKRAMAVLRNYERSDPEHGTRQITVIGGLPDP